MSVIKLIKKILTIFPSEFERNIYWYKNRITRNTNLNKWKSSGSLIPPPHQYKQFIVEHVSKEQNYKVLIETGTFMGHMIEAQRNNFLKLYSIEVEPTLYLEASRYFSPYHHIQIIQGDSSLKLGQILDEVANESILFWLDGHYSGGNTGMGDKQCPIYEELQTIFDHNIRSKYILIDDARCFNGTYDYPTLKELTEFVARNEISLRIQILNDIIHIY